MIARVAAVTAAALLCAWGLVHLAYVPHRCNAEITRLTARTDAAGKPASDYERLLRVRRNLQDLEPLRETCPTEVRVPMLMGANHEIAGRPEDALRSYREALAIEQRPEIYVAIAVQQIQTGRVDEAIDNYVTAARFDPNLVPEIHSRELRRRVAERLRVTRDALAPVSAGRGRSQ